MLASIALILPSHYNVQNQVPCCDGGAEIQLVGLQGCKALSKRRD
jgi:hypothetical protein